MWLLALEACERQGSPLLQRVSRRAPLLETSSSTESSLGLENSTLVLAVGEPNCYGLYELLNLASNYYMPLILLLGLVGNLLSGLVFLTNQLRARSSSYYLAALAVADFGFLSVLLLSWLDTSLGWRCFNTPGWCTAVIYVSSVCSSLSIWLIVGFTAERFVAVQYPLHRPRVCTASRAKTIVIVLGLLALVAHSYCFVTADVVTFDDGSYMCDMRPEYFETMNVLNLIDTIFSLICPLVLILTMNACIWRNLRRFGRRFEQSCAAPSHLAARPPGKLNKSVSNSSNVVGHGIPMSSILSGLNHGSNQSIQYSQNNNNNNSSSYSRFLSSLRSQQMTSSKCQVYNISDNASQCIHIGSSARNVMSTRNQRNITKMLLLISTVFITLNSPSYLIRLCVFCLTLVHKYPPTLLWCSQQLFMYLYYTNFSVNFLLYTMYGITFRRCLGQIFFTFIRSVNKCLCPSRY